MAKRGAGVITRHIPSWYMREMYGGRHSQAASVGNISYVELFNSSAKGGLIYVWSVNTAASGQDELVPEWYYGKHQTSAGGSAPLYSAGPAGYAVIGGWNNSTCVGVEIGDWITTATRGVQWPHNWPLAIITAGYSFAIHTAGTNEILDAGIWWQESTEY